MLSRPVDVTSFRSDFVFRMGEMFKENMPDKPLFSGKEASDGLFKILFLQMPPEQK